MPISVYDILLPTDRYHIGWKTARRRSTESVRGINATVGMANKPTKVCGLTTHEYFGMTRFAEKRVKTQFVNDFEIVTARSICSFEHIVLQLK